MKTINLFAIALLCSLVLSCDQEEIEPQDLNDHSDFIDGQDIEELAQFSFSYFEEEQGSTSGRVGGNIEDETQYVTGAAPGGWEADYSLPGGYILSGVGLTVTDDNVSLMVLERRYLNDNGTLGARYISRHGRKANEANWGIESFIQAPNNHAISGIEVWCKNDRVYKTRIYTRAINSARRLVGPERIYTAGLNRSDRELLIKTELIPDVQTIETSVLTGLGVRVAGDDFKGMKAYIGTVK